MNMFRKGTLALCALLSLSFAVPAQQAKAEGFATPLESSARGMALGGGLVARGGDPSVIAFNPAAMTRLEGTQVQGNLAITQMYWGVDMDKYNAQGVKEGRENYHSAHQTWPIPSWYLTHQYNDKLWLGIGQHTRFGLGVKYPNEWPGAANLQSVQLITSSISPTIAYKLTDKISIGVGAEVLYADMTMKKQLVGQGGSYFGYNVGDTNINGQGFAFGGNISLHAQLNDQWSVGFMYRAPMSLKVDGKARYDAGVIQAMGKIPGSGLDQALIANGGKHNLRGTIHLPDSFAFGVAYKPIPTLSIEAGAVYTMWSRFEKFNMYMEYPLSTTKASTRQWRNSWAFNISAEWWAYDWMALRVGFVYDRSPMNSGNADFMMPSNCRNYYTCGLGFKWNNWTLDLSYMYAHNHMLDYSSSTQEGVNYKNGNGYYKAAGTTHPHAHNFGIGIGYKF